MKLIITLLIKHWYHLLEVTEKSKNFPGLEHSDRQLRVQDFDTLNRSLSSTRIPVSAKVCAAYLSVTIVQVASQLEAQAAARSEPSDLLQRGVPANLI